MGRINDTGKYPYDDIISGDDFLIGSDAENDGKTKNYRVSDLAIFFNQNAGSKTDASFYFEQETASSLWIVPHYMNKYPTPMILDEDGEIIITDIKYVSLNVCHVIFGRPTKGSGTFN